MRGRFKLGVGAVVSCAGRFCPDKDDGVSREGCSGCSLIAWRMMARRGCSGLHMSHGICPSISLQAILVPSKVLVSALTRQDFGFGLRKPISSCFASTSFFSQDIQDAHVLAQFTVTQLGTLWA